MFAGLGWAALVAHYIGTSTIWRLILVLGMPVLLGSIGAICFLYPAVRDYLNSSDSADN